VYNPLAHQALQHEMNPGLLLPVNAIVYESSSQMHVVVMDAAMLPVVGNASVEHMARRGDEALRRAIDNIAG
jgi:uncharacterized protein (DUF302 family)